MSSGSGASNRANTSYKAKSNKNNSSIKRRTSNNGNNQTINQTGAPMAKSRGYNNNGYKNVNNYNQQSNNDSQMSNTLKKVKEKQKKAVAKKAIVTGANAISPVAGAVADKVLETEKGEKLLDAYAQGDTPQEGIKNVVNEINKQQNTIKMLQIGSSFFLPILFLLIIVSAIFKNADSQIYSNENGGTVNSNDNITDEEKEDPNLNVFANYPGLYEKIEKVSAEVSKKYEVEIDRYLIISTLIAPIENDLITPIDDSSCGEEACYRYNEESVTWEEFVELISDEAELLAKMQIMTYVNPASFIDVICGSEQTMEQYSKNDLKVTSFSWFDLFTFRWFAGYTDMVKAEINAKCTQVPSPLYAKKIPTVYVLSKEQGVYHSSLDENNELVFEKDPNTGGVYFWNLVNPNGFLHHYLRDYLSNESAEEDIDKNYEINQKTIVDTANYIYSYYDSIKKECESHKILESSIEKIKVYNPPEKQRQFGVLEHEEVDFEDQYIGGVLLAEYNSGDLESLKAFAILARSEAIANVGLDGSGEIENSSNRQNYNPEYSPEKYPKIAEAVEATRGLVLSKYQEAKVWHTEYDAFCPVKTVVDNQGFYYLSEGQQNFAISPGAYESVTGKTFIASDSKYLDCPCFQNNQSRPQDSEEEANVRYYSSPDEAPTFAGGNPPQETKASCWTNVGETKTAEDGSILYKWKYKATGGHGRGASQYGLKYFEAFGYDQDALLRLFFPGASVRVLSSSLPVNKCQNIDYFTDETDNHINYDSITDYNGSDYSQEISGNALNMPLTEALAKNGYTVNQLNDCIFERVSNAGYGTREGVVEAGMGLLECTKEMTGGYTYPYDHRGGWVNAEKNPDISGKLGVNSKWGNYENYATGCSGAGACRLGLNCANYVRWSMCNGGMDLCSKGSTYATGMAGYLSSEDYFPGATRVMLTTSFKVLSGSINVTSKYDAIDKIKPGDVLYSDSGGNGNHVMLIVGVNENSITIAENGRGTRIITKDELANTRKHTYVVLLLDDYYANASNAHSMTW